MDLEQFNPRDVHSLDDNRLRALASQVLQTAEKDRQLNQIFYYQPVSDRAMKVHESTAHKIGVSGGNGSSKTESCLVDMIARATGIFPDCLSHLKDKKFRGPVNCRVVVESITATLHNIILRKLRWNAWTGVDQPGGERGHWGWVPKDCLIDGSWEKSWSEKLRTLTVLCRDPHQPERILGESTIQFMSHDNDPSDFASGDFHIILLDEPPSLPIFRENEARAMRVNGQIYLAMTWPDDPAMPVDWIFDELYDKSRYDDDVDWFELHTIENKNLDLEAVFGQMRNWDDQTTAVRIYGKPIRFSNLIHPDFTDTEEYWSFEAGKKIIPLDKDGKKICPETGSDDIIRFNHVGEIEYFETVTSLPTIFLIDPHPRKPHMFIWVKVGADGDLHVVADGAIDGTPADVAKFVYDTEDDLKLNVKSRIMDPNMGASPGSARERHVSWQDEFGEAGLWCDLGDDSWVGRSRVNEYLRPDPNTRFPRLTFHPRCQRTIDQMKRYAWAEYKKTADRDVKQTPRDKNDDYPTLLKYLMNSDPDFSRLAFGAPIVRREGMTLGY